MICKEFLCPLLIATNGFLEQKKLFEILDKVGIDKNIRVHELNDEQIILIRNEISNYDVDNLHNDELIINKNINLTSYYIKNEYHTLGNLLVDYMFQLDESTKLLNLSFFKFKTDMIILDKISVIPIIQELLFIYY